LIALKWPKMTQKYIPSLGRLGLWYGHILAFRKLTRASHQRKSEHAEVYMQAIPKFLCKQG